MTDYLFNHLPLLRLCNLLLTVDIRECQDSCCSQVLVTHGDENDFSLHCCHVWRQCLTHFYLKKKHFKLWNCVSNLFKKKKKTISQDGSHTVVNVLWEERGISSLEGSLDLGQWRQSCSCCSLCFTSFMNWLTCWSFKTRPRNDFSKTGCGYVFFF